LNLWALKQNPIDVNKIKKQRQKTALFLDVALQSLSVSVTLPKARRE
jgi:hypothetical protein